LTLKLYQLLGWLIIGGLALANYLALKDFHRMLRPHVIRWLHELRRA
jgi:hypothetical protein